MSTEMEVMKSKMLLFEGKKIIEKPINERKQENAAKLSWVGCGKYRDIHFMTLNLVLNLYLNVHEY